MKSFKDLGVTPATKGFDGDKISIERLLDREIIVLDFKIVDSKYDKGSGKCLHLHIKLNDENRVVFTGSLNLIETIQHIKNKSEDLPFKTTIKKNNRQYSFN